MWPFRKTARKEVNTAPAHDISEPVIAILEKLKNHPDRFAFSPNGGWIECKDLDTKLKMTGYIHPFGHSVITEPSFGITTYEQKEIAMAIESASRKKEKDQQQKVRKELIEKYCK